MGSFSGICHVTGLPIEEGEDIVVMVTRYAGIKDPMSMVYVTDHDCAPVSLPIFGKYDGYGCIETAEKQLSANSFLSGINAGLMGSPKMQERIKTSPMAVMVLDKYAIFKHEDRAASHANLEFYDDVKLSKLRKEVMGGDFSSIYPKEKFESIEELLKCINDRGLCDIGSGIGRFGYVTIKESVINKMKSGMFSDYIDSVTAEMEKYFDIDDLDYSSPEAAMDTMRRFSPDEISSKYLRIHNGTDKTFRKISNDLKVLMRALREGGVDKNLAKQNTKKAIDSIALAGLIINFYDYTNKSFYPRSSCNFSMDAMLELNQMVEDEVQEIRQRREHGLSM